LRCPVIIVNRAGAHSGLLLYADANTTPCDANRSTAGARTTECPYTGRNGAPN
jgi:hypothetical protein